MNTHRADELVEVRRRLVKTQIIGTIAAICIGLAIYGLFVAKGNAFHPLLNHSKVLAQCWLSAFFWRFSI